MACGIVRTAWNAGRLAGSGPPRLVFGRMYEDPEVELRSLPAGRLLVIASAGDVAFALAAAGRDVVAIDINPAQVEYVRDRVAGGLQRAGQADRYLARAAKALPLMGMSTDRLRKFFDLDDPGVQVRVWRKLAGRRFRAALALAFGPALRFAYRSDLASALPHGFAGELESRFERGFAIHPNRSNPIAPALFGLPTAPASAHHIELEQAEVLQFMRAQPPGSFDGFALSNITDGAPADFKDELLTAARRIARSGAIAVLRTFGAPRGREDSARAASDRALIWGGIDTVAVG
jgi:S-adenosylmethionine:diacylglycerol 3-amino-3-carboxypropyl transferase